MVFVQDQPSDPVMLVTNANVVDGKFTYAGTAGTSRKNAATISYRDQSDHDQIKPMMVVEDHDAIARYGRREIEITLPFCNSHGAAQREGRWLIDSSQNQRETVTYAAGFDHAHIRPGDKILISDRHRVGVRLGGRLSAIEGSRDRLKLDAPAVVQEGQSYTIHLMTSLNRLTTLPVVPHQVENGKAILWQVS